MADQTGIEWTNATWNPVAGCSVVSPGCTNCYAMRMAARLERMGQAKYAGLTQPSKAGAVWTGKIATDDAALTQPLRWKKPRRIFVNSMSDLFHDGVPEAFIDKVFAVMALTPQHTYQVLTKRADRMRDYLNATSRPGRIARAILDMAIANPSLLRVKPWPVQSIGPAEDPHDVTITFPLLNVWLGVSVENQKFADERIPLLLDTPAAVRWISAEPLLGPIDLRSIAASDVKPSAYYDLAYPHGPGLFSPQGKRIRDARLDWVVAGGESGPDARPMHPDWARDIRDQCGYAGVPFFFKQWGEFRPIYDRDRDDPDWQRCNDIATESPNGQWLNLAGGQGFHGDRVVRVQRLGKKAAGHLLDGVEHRAYPR